ncbi:putative actin depolymerization factor [Ordospora colligata]|uniref:Putative actin depolymerization factor n=1 Tax=Ordospora colligata OC4 TaxID=1354746 RepID=A0A0B2UK58_9MICR|nr:putative actin depolymerization factor [Ordospora colligata OC4]KHN69624.1 putative actin depolymerization factor [Ordospora colligata OC4]TBU15743.1 putative actin depolymerization factor [Ordospora colligata]TBU15871.1 putative actin depolymerization factor [Ordospora colligata]TBU18765.1 putative actin depolymerization factor [Ordospora colligata]
MDITIPGIDVVRAELKKIMSGVQRYTILSLSEEKPTSLSIVKSGGCAEAVGGNKRYTVEELRRIFEEFSSNVQDNVPCFAIYDFVYFDDDRIQKKTLCLVSYIPENLAPQKNVPYSTNALNLKDVLNISMHISIKRKIDLEFDNFVEKCTALRMK